MSKLDDILQRNFGDSIWAPEAKQEFKDLMLELIGENEDNKHPVYGQSHSFYRNNLKAELRKKVEEL